MIRIGKIEKWLNDFRLKHSVLLPKIQHPDDFAFVLRRTFQKIQKSCLHVFSESRSKNILLDSKLMTGLSDDRVYHVESRNFVFRFALKNIAKKTQILTIISKYLYKYEQLTFCINFSTLCTTCL